MKTRQYLNRSPVAEGTRSELPARYSAKYLIAASVLALGIASTAEAQDRSQSAPQPAGADASPTTQNDGTDAVEVEEVLVTARRREERLLSVPMSVTLVNQSSLQAENIVRASDLADLVPGVTANATGGSRFGGQINIRGQSGQFTGGGGGVTTYFMEVPGFFESQGTPFDISNVQVLRGPQGTLFGKVSTGGALLYTPNLPGDETEGFLRARIGSFDQREAEFGITLPLVKDVFSVRVAGGLRFLKGFGTNLYNGNDLDGENTNGLRASARLNLGPIENVTLYQITRIDNGGRSYVQGMPALTSASTGNNRPIPVAVASQIGLNCGASAATACPTWYQYMVTEANDQASRSPWSVDYNQGSNIVIDTEGLINSTTFKVSDWLTLRNIASVSQRSIAQLGVASGDPSRLPIQDIVSVPDGGDPVWTEELQAQIQVRDNLFVQAGLYYDRADGHFSSLAGLATFGGWQTSLASASAAACSGTAAALRYGKSEYSSGYCHLYAGYLSVLSKSESETFAQFIQANWDVTPNLSITVGARNTEVETRNWSSAVFGSVRSPGATGGDLSTGLFPYYTVTTPAGPTDRIIAPGIDTSSIVPRVVSGQQATYLANVSYKINDSNFIYVSARTGYKPGGINTGATVPTAVAAYGPEDLIDYEIGYKSLFQFGATRGIFEISAYRDEYDDIQRTITVTGTTGSPVNLTSNAAKARIQGADISASAQFSEAFSVAGSVSYTDAKYLEYPNTGQIAGVPIGFDLTSSMFANVSEWTARITPTVRLNKLVADAPDLRFSATASYRGEYAATEPNVGIFPRTILPSRTTVNLRAEWRRVAKMPVDLSFGVINATDLQGPIGVVDQTRASTGYFYQINRQPRAYYLQMNYAF